jgi:hypothetical protein
MTPEEIDALTLEEIEAIIDRLERTPREDFVREARTMRTQLATVAYFHKQNLKRWYAILDQREAK